MSDSIETMQPRRYAETPISIGSADTFWYPYVPRHGVTLLVGDPGTGKSLLSALICATVSRGNRFPLSSDRPHGKRVLILSAEDSWPRTTLPRFLKAGGDVDQVHVMDRFRVLDDRVLAELRSHIEEWPPALVVIDTVSAFMGSARDMHRQNEVGEFLAALTEIAEKSGGAVLGLAHMNKQGSEDPLYRIVGSIGFAATVRSVVFFGNDQDGKTRRLLAHGKMNASEKGKTIIFEITGGGRHGFPVLQPVGFSEQTEWDVCRSEHKPVGRPNVEQERAAGFILETLGARPIAWADLLAKAEPFGLSAGTLNLVRAQLVKDKKITQVGSGRAAKWKIPPGGDELRTDRCAA